ncbi:MAG: hypothetical protein BM564_02160 [Bacteroidetes bacterium MedPE-SWsnd-G2]|nr:MAG: hypothetical protein BM564_02160 [Bacteroidetes bacterium MedPE-SWsnd-G2]
MFSDSKTRRTTTDNLSQQNTIANGTAITGDISSKGDFRIEGRIEGNISTSGKIVIGKTGIVIGSLVSSHADIEGQFSGKLQLSNTLTLRSTAQVDGEVEVGKLAVEPGAGFNATCVMKSSVKKLGHGEKTKKEKSA